VAFTDLFDQPIVTPFLNLEMSQISFESVRLQNTQIFVTDFASTILLTPSVAATHMPTKIYDYM
jgi:hypothetical protein